MDMVLITKHFPYNQGNTPGETFLDAEIFVLSSLAERIYVIAAEAESHSSVSVTLPENVTAIALANKLKYGTKLQGILSGLTRIVKKSSELKEEVNGNSLKKRFFAYYFDARAHRIATEAKRFLDSYPLAQDVLIYSYWFYYHAQAGVLLKKMLEKEKKNISCFSRAHRYDLYEYNNPMEYIPYRNYLLKELDRVFPCSVDGKCYLTERYGHVEKIKTVYLGTKDYGIGKGSTGSEKVVLSCSRIVPVKRVRRIAETLAEMGGKCPIKWIHFGGGDGLEEIRSFCEKTSVNYDFKGNTPNTEVLRFYSENAIDAFLNVSESEGLPISIMEALSFGMPVIATDVGGTSEVVRDGETGFLLDKDFTNQELAEKIEHVLNMPRNEYQALRDNCRKMWESKFMFEKNTREMIEEVSQCLTNYN